MKRQTDSGGPDPQMDEFNVSNFPYVLATQALVERSREDFDHIYQRWVRVSKKLARHRGDPQGHAHEHLDAHIDLLLRGIETEQASAFSMNDDKFGGGVFFLQIALSKCWLFTVYEIIRQSCDFPCSGKTEKSAYCDQEDCLRCNAIRPIREELGIYRIPLAKLEPERKKRAQASVQNYHSKLEICVENGSVGWRSESDRKNGNHIKSRLELSNLILDKLGA